MTIRILTRSMFVAAIINAFAPTPLHDPHHIEIIIDGFLTLVSLALVIADFRRP